MRISTRRSAPSRDRSLGEVAHPHGFLDATCKARVNRRVVSHVVVIANALTADGRRDVLGFDVDDSEDGACWTAFLRSLKARAGRCPVDYLRCPHRAQSRDRLGVHRRELAALPGALHAPRARDRAQGQPGDGRRREPHDLRPTRRRTRPRAVRGHRRHARQEPAQGRADAPRGAHDDLLALTGFPAAHGTKIRSTNPSSGSTRKVNAAPTSA